MDARTLIIMLIVGVVAGFLASVVVGGGGGLIRYLIIGLIGSFAGGFLFKQLVISLGIGNQMVREIIVATIGAIIVVLLARLIA
ncbi:MAG: GlsB/YeaQ/YmgE family stress response membrane protein [Pseudomonadota bacterium]